MPRSAAVAALLQLAVVCSLAVSVQHAPSEGGGLMGNPADIENVETGTTWFSVRIKVPTGESASKEPQAKLMGWQLGSEQGSPVQVLKIRSQGIVARHNAGGGERPILAGDELVEVNGVKWSGDTRAFEALLGHEIQAALKSKEKAPLLRLTVQRRPGAAAAGGEARGPSRAGRAAAAVGTQEKRKETRGEKASGSADLLEKKESRERRASGSAGAQVDRDTSNVEGLIAAWNSLHQEQPIELNHEALHEFMAKQHGKH
ncbi:unnamed protein product [Prorocentrum cordatum]|uniref:PDZ domain-containing protein n=1 Tax=Prorocentrum cordatum TaxID=2364126 RepID=A0ABN9WIU9_9DINO|nr:unnamed protein product [Polarella glacialis]